MAPSLSHNLVDACHGSLRCGDKALNFSLHEPLISIEYLSGFPVGVDRPRASGIPETMHAYDVQHVDLKAAPSTSAYELLSRPGSARHFDVTF